MTRPDGVAIDGESIQDIAGAFEKLAGNIQVPQSFLDPGSYTPLGDARTRAMGALFQSIDQGSRLCKDLKDSLADVPRILTSVAGAQLELDQLHGDALLRRVRELDDAERVIPAAGN